MSTVNKCNLERMLSITGASGELAELSGLSPQSLLELYETLLFLRDAANGKGQIEAFWQYIATAMNALATKGNLVYKPGCDKGYIASEILDSPYIKHIRAIAAE